MGAPPAIVAAPAGTQFGVHIVGTLLNVSESGASGLHIHVGMDPTDASTIGGHYWVPLSAVDPWILSGVLFSGGEVQSYTLCSAPAMALEVLWLVNEALPWHARVRRCESR